MAQATVSARIDSKDKEKFDKFCDNVGLSASAAIYMFIKNVINEHRIPFEIREPIARYNAREASPTLQSPFYIETFDFCPGKGLFCT
ncbi:MAG: type II toxin-antitoxin system RelB/DinJ family antitoxin [Fibrobacter sp.]|nr:type II toxin-antitoxin system RelB/DinJ family antitoxin [Fibrobacter sp.]